TDRSPTSTALGLLVRRIHHFPQRRQGSIGMNNGLIAAGRLALLALGIAVAGSGLGGCASAEMDKLQDLNRSLTNRNQEMQQELASSKNENGILQKQRAANEAAINDLRRSNGDLV